MITKEQAINHIRFGKQGDYVTNDDNDRTITRASDHIDTLPDCYIEQGDLYIGKLNFHDAIDFLFETV